MLHIAGASPPCATFFTDCRICHCMYAHRGSHGGRSPPTPAGRPE